MVPDEIVVAGASRPLPGEVENGDGWQLDRTPAGWRLAVIDGLGHGPAAAAATSAALTTLAAATDLRAAEAIAICHRALLGGRGAVMAVACIDRTQRRLIYAGVGNIDARLWTPEREQRLISYRGIVGHTLPTLRTVEAVLPDIWLLALSSDGLGSKWELNESAAALLSEPATAVDEILARWARSSDDATLVVAQPRRATS